MENQQGGGEDFEDPKLHNKRTDEFKKSRAEQYGNLENLDRKIENELKMQEEREVARPDLVLPSEDPDLTLKTANDLMKNKLDVELERKKLAGLKRQETDKVVSQPKTSEEKAERSTVANRIIKFLRGGNAKTA